MVFFYKSYLKDGFEILEIYVAQFVEPEVVKGCRGLGEVVLLKAFIAQGNSGRELGQDPTIHGSQRSGLGSENTSTTLKQITRQIVNYSSN